MQPKWLIEPLNDSKTETAMVNAVKSKGYECVVTKYKPFESGAYTEFADEDCVVFCGSLNLARQLVKQKNWVPGPWLTLKNYECSCYYTFLGEFLFNRNYAILPRTEIKNNRQFVWNAFGESECVFMRPNSGFKTFTGQVFAANSFDADWLWVEANTEPDSLVVVSTPKNIKLECRFVVAEGNIVTSSSYRCHGALKYDVEVPQKATEKCKNILAVKDWAPDPIWVIDICSDMLDNFYLLEIGSFSCAGLYNCDYNKIVEVASALALKEWNEYYYKQ